MQQQPKLLRKTNMRLRQFLEKVEKPTGDLKDACWKGYTAVGMKMKNGRKVPNCVPVKEAVAKDDVPFDPPYSNGKKQTTPGKYGSGYSTARHLARMAAKREMDKLKKKPVKEETEKLEELSNELLGRYKKAAGVQASAADKAGNFAKGNKRFSGIVKATKKQFANDEKKNVTEQHREEGRFKPTVPHKVPNVSVASPGVRRTNGARKAEIVKSAAKKTAVVKDKFEPNPELGTTLTKNV